MAHSYASPALSDWTSPSSTPMLTYKKGGETGYMPINSQKNLTRVPDSYPASPALYNLQKIERIQNYNDIFAQILGLVSVALTVSMDYILLYTLYKFYTTKDIPAPQASPPRTSPWAAGTQLWPAFLLAISSAVTFLIDFFALVASCCHRFRGRGKKAESRLTIAGYIVFVLKWVAVAVLYRLGKTSKDLWGWSCDEKVRSFEQFYATELNFERLCREQTYAWYLSITEWALKAILMVVALFLAWKVKKLNRKR